MTKERPIIFSPEMIRGILDGRKTMTRRVIKGKALELLNNNVHPDCEVFDDPDAKLSPYGYPGDRLWVRETWRDVIEQSTVQYRADYGGLDVNDINALMGRRGGERINGHYPWRPSIHMPRWASRILLEIEEVRAERLQDITEEDAQAEGSYLDRCECLPRCNDKTPIEAAMKQAWCHIHGQEFKALWNSLNAKRGYGWDANPWVWAIRFKVLQPTPGLLQ